MELFLYLNFFVKFFSSFGLFVSSINLCVVGFVFFCCKCLIIVGLCFSVVVVVVGVIVCVIDFLCDCFCVWVCVV